MTGSAGRLYRERIKPEVAVYLEANYPGFFEQVLRLARSVVAFHGATTGEGAADGSSLVCSDLAGKPDYDGNQVVITSGDYAGQARDIDGSTTGGTVTPHEAFGGRIASGVELVILALRTVPAEVAGLLADIGDASGSALGSIYAILGNPAQDFLTMIGYEGATSLADKLTAARAALIDAINARTDKLAGETPVSGSVTADWSSGVATSGEAGGDVATLGAAGTRYKVHSLVIDIGRGGLTGTDIRVKLFMAVNGVERKVYEQSFDATADAPGLWVINGTVGIHETLRVELESNAAGDDGREVHYDYMLEAM